MSALQREVPKTLDDLYAQLVVSVTSTFKAH